MAKTVCKILGVVFLLVGVAGFAAPTSDGFSFGTGAQSGSHFVGCNRVIPRLRRLTISRENLLSCLRRGLPRTGNYRNGDGGCEHGSHVEHRAAGAWDERPRAAYPAWRGIPGRRTVYEKPLGLQVLAAL